jgi:ATP-binding cassette subfamily B protein
MHDAQTLPASPAAPRTGDALLWRVGRQGGGWLVLTAASALVLAVVETAFPAVLGRAVDAALSRHAASAWLVWFGLVLGLLVALDMVEDLTGGTATASSTAWLRRTLTHHLLRLPPGSGGVSAGDVVNRMVGNTADAGRIGPTVVRAVANLVPAVGAMAALAVIDIWLFVTFVVGLPLALLVVRAFSKDISAAIRRYLEVQGRIAGRLVDALDGARTIAAAGTQEQETARVLAPLPELHEAGMAMWRAQTNVLTKEAILVPVLEVAVLAVAGFELSRGRITVGALLAAGQYVLLGATFTSAVGAVAQVARARSAAQRAADILAEEPIRFGSSALPDGPGAVELHGITVTMGDDTVLDAIDLAIPPRALVAVVGRSGSGKSVLAAVLGRMVVPDEGRVLLDGNDLAGLDRRSLRSAISFGFERPSLVGETVGDAIAFGEPVADDRSVVAAATAARADQFIRRMPHSYATRLAYAPLSGGELQRVGLARAFAHAGRVLVLDDVAASLDSATERHVAGALTGALANRTRVVVAHRASTAARADFVVWLDQGRVRAVAPHAELWAQASYRALFEPEDSAVAGEGGGGPATAMAPR